jgi:alpha-D-ribose 1-methylphosphonate 5-triphosphate diphosphatase
MNVADMRALADAIGAGQARGRLRADHFIHLRCEVSSPDVMEGYGRFEDDPRVRLVSLMDHSPGQRQFTTLAAYRGYYQRKTGMSDREFQAFVDRRLAEAARWSDLHRDTLSEACRARGIVLASHDDATEAHVADAARHGVALSEFPTTMEAARASRRENLKVLMGAPNIVRGGSHSGNIAARDLAEDGLLDVLSSDYVPCSLLQATFMLADAVDGLDLPQAVAMVTANPANAAGLDDRGAIAPGKRADLIQVRLDDGIPVVRSVWRQGMRVA